MKIASWNVNSLKVRLEQVLDWCGTAKPDVLALQGEADERRSTASPRRTPVHGRTGRSSLQGRMPTLRIE